MTLQALSAPRWLTASFDRAPMATPLEMRALGDHLHLCRRCSGRWFRLRCGAEAIHGFMMARCFTTLAAAAVLMALGWLIA